MKRITLIFTIFMALFSFAQNENTKDFSDFEKKLISGNINYNYIKNDSARTDSADTNSDSTEFTKSDDKTFNIEKEPDTAEISITPYLEARQALLNAIKKKNKNLVRQQISALEDMKTYTILPLEMQEKESIYIELDMYKDYLDMLAKHYKTIYDSINNKNLRHIADEEDELVLHVKKNLDKRDKQQSFYSTIEKKIQKSTLSKLEKEKLQILVLLRDAYNKKFVRTKLIKLTKNFIENYPDDSDVNWIKKSIYEPLKKMDYKAYYMELRKKDKENIIKDAIYTWALGLNVGYPLLSNKKNFDRLYRKDLFEPKFDPFNIQLYLQFGRFMIIHELSVYGIEGVYGLTMGIGVIAYENRYLKIRPYLASSLIGTEIWARDDIQYHDDASDDLTAGSYTMAVDIDFKFATLYLPNSYNKFASFSIVNKFGLTYLEIDGAHAKGSGISRYYQLGLGISLW